jgi:hypothetical protein
VASTNSNDFSAASRNSLTTSFRVGDYVTAIYLPKNLAKSLRLYGFLDLRPDIGLIAAEHKEQTRPVQLLLAVIFGFGFFGALFWNVYAFGRYAPLEWNFAQLAIPFAAGAILLGGGLLTFLAVTQARNRRRIAERNEAALAAGKPFEMEPTKQGWFGSHGRFLSLVLIAGAMLLGGGTTMCWAFSLNAMLDNSPPRQEPAMITEMVMVTHSFIFREYQIKYQLLKGDHKEQSLLSTPDHMSELRGPLAIAEIHSGWLGWPWVKDLAPCKAPAGLKDAPDKDRQD